MEKDTVILSLKDYNELREFKEEILKGNILVIEQDSYYGSRITTRYYSNDQVFKDLTDKIHNLETEKQTLHLDIKDLRFILAQTKSDLSKKISFKQFIKQFFKK